MPCNGLEVPSLFKAIARIVINDVCRSLEVVYRYIDNADAVARCAGGSIYVKASLRLRRANHHSPYIRRIVQELALSPSEVYKVVLKLKRWENGVLTHSRRRAMVTHVILVEDGDACKVVSRKTLEYTDFLTRYRTPTFTPSNHLTKYMVSNVVSNPFILLIISIPMHLVKLAVDRWLGC